jgi:hypothetical protein
MLERLSNNGSFPFRFGGRAMRLRIFKRIFLTPFIRLNIIDGRLSISFNRLLPPAPWKEATLLSGEKNRRATI